MKLPSFLSSKPGAANSSATPQPIRVLRSGGLFIVTILVAIAFSLPLLRLAELRREYYFFDVDLTSTTAGRTEIFFDVGHGFREQDSSAQPLSVHPRKVKYRYLLPAQTIGALRFDPTDKEGVLTLSNAQVSDLNGKVIARFAPTDFTAVQQIASMSVEDGELKITTVPSANDPIIEIHLAKPLKLRLTWLLYFRRLAPTVFIIVLGLYIFSALLASSPIRSWMEQMKWLRTRPVSSLAFISLIAVCLQCHPVIFFGKSFVSPNNGSFFYYGTFPSLPGSSEAEVEEEKGSDVAAMLHQSLYYPSMQHEAVLKHGELPLWNRYSTCGVPLLGQGQSMFGSLLNLIPFFGNSSSWSWDLRYVVSRWLFGFGLGLSVWLTTRCFRSAGVVAFTGIFAGFFVFRVNHMAQFSADAAPWILVGWILLSQATTPRAKVVGAVALFIGNWEVFTSGTVKEACTLLLCSNIAGLLSVLIADLPWKQRVNIIAVAAFSGLIFLLLSSPILVCFTRAMASSHTTSDQPFVTQIPGWYWIALFDDYFYGRMNVGEGRVLPATNLVIYIGIAWALVGIRQNVRDRFFWGLLAAMFLAAFVVFGVIPSQWILRTPLLRNINHVHNTFSCALVVLLPVLAGFGFRSLLACAASRHWHKYCLLVGLAMAWPVIDYFRHSWTASGTPFFRTYINVVLLAVLIIYLTITSWRRSAQKTILFVGLPAAAFLLIWRQGQYLATPLDDYVFNPRQRVEFRPQAPSMEWVSQKVAQEPSRPAGLHMNLFCGYNEMLGWESIFGVDAVRSYQYDKMAAVGGLNKLLWGAPGTLQQLGGEPGQWHEDDLDFILPLQNMLGVRYYLETPPSIPSSKKLHRMVSLDLDIYESDQAWPRAFFTESLVTYNTLNQFIKQVRSNNESGPFAAIELADAADIIVALRPKGSPVAKSARNYRLSANSTAFTVDANNAGVAVLMENYFAGDFRAYINNREVPYYRMNYSFKGVVIPGPGTYEIRFEYWPRYLTAALWACGAGVFLAVAAVWMAYRRTFFRARPTANSVA